MKDTIQQSGSDVSIVIYDTPSPPKYFRFTKKFINTLFVVVPTLFVLSLSGFFLWGLTSRVMLTPTPNFPIPLNEQDSKIAALESEVKTLESSNYILTNKLNTQVAPTDDKDPNLMMIKKPYGMQNQTNLNIVSLEQIEFISSNNKVNLKFQIISQGLEKKVLGHIIVFMISASGLMAYPVEANDSILEGIKYSQGERFAVSRLRPTNAEFIHRLVGDSARFVIYIFTREGDLILHKETEVYKIGPKV